MAAALDQLSSTQAEANAGIERWRLGPDMTTALDAIDTAATSAAQVPTLWARIEAGGKLIGGLVDDLLRHDGLVFRATTAGRQGQWLDALNALDDAGAALAAAGRRTRQRWPRGHGRDAQRSARP